MLFRKEMEPVLNEIGRRHLVIPKHRLECGHPNSTDKCICWSFDTVHTSITVLHQYIQVYAFPVKYGFKGEIAHNSFPDCKTQDYFGEIFKALHDALLFSFTVKY